MRRKSVVIPGSFPLNLAAVGLLLSSLACGRAPAASTAATARPIASAPGYCFSSGGSIEYENIETVTLTRTSDGTADIEVSVRISNPDGCTADKPCPRYDESPIYVHVWIDWNKNGIWEPSEQIPIYPLTGYKNINYQGTMTAHSAFTIPAGATVDPTWMRANLGWGFDPNDPCLQSWERGDVFDQQVLPPARFYDFSAMSPGSNRNLPQTGSVVTLSATIEVPAGYSVTGCTWNQASAQGQVTTVPVALPADPLTHWVCTYTYDTSTGPAGDGTHGNKTVDVAATYGPTGSATTDTISATFPYKVFFARDGVEYAGQPRPNWFVYWGDGATTTPGDHAVPGFTSTVLYDPSMVAVGRYAPAGDTLTLGQNTSGNRFPAPFSLLSIPNLCPGGTFPQVSGIDTVAQVIGLLNRKKAQYHNVHDTTGIWHGLKDSDGDGLPDTYETGTLKTSPNVPDSCGIASALGDSSLSATGDAELDALIASQGLTGDASRDWANPGKQADAVPSPTLPPKFSGFSAATPGSYRNLPEAGKAIALTTLIELPAGYTVTACTWNGPSVAGTLTAVSSTQWKCAGSYSAPAGITGHGQKSVTVSVTYGENGLLSTANQAFSYEVFFDRSGSDDGVRPNWFLYWGTGGDRAVPGFTSDIQFDPAVPSLGRYSPADDRITLGPGASGNRFPAPIVLAPIPHQCPGGTFPQASGIDSVAQVIGALNRKKAQYHSLHDAGGAWYGRPDTDGDGLADMYEARGLMTSPLMTDSCGLAQALGDSSLASTADAELDAMIAARALAGVPSRDWANPGKQADATPSPSLP